MSSTSTRTLWKELEKIIPELKTLSVEEFTLHMKFNQDPRLELKIWIHPTQPDSFPETKIRTFTLLEVEEEEEKEVTGYK